MSSESNPAETSAPVVEAFHYPQAQVAGAGGSYASPMAPDGCYQGPDRSAGESLAQRLNQAREEGIREGEQRERKKLEQEIAQQRARIADALSAFERERSEYYSKIEAEVVNLAVAIAAKILHRESQVDRMLLAALVKVALEKLQQNTKVIIRVAPQQSGPWRDYFAQNAPTSVKPEIVEDDSLAPGNCVLETELGSTEFGLESQLKEVETGLFDLLAQRPDPPAANNARATPASR